MLRNIDEETIAILIDNFYARIRADALLGPIFTSFIADDRWPAHLDRMRRFWSSIMMASGRYRGKPLEIHRRLGALTPEMFQRWLALFDEICVELLTPSAAAAFRVKAAHIAANLQSGLAVAPPRFTLVERDSESD